jgi:hypothetical protein
MSFNGEISVANGNKSGVVLRLQIPYQKSEIDSKQSTSSVKTPFSDH